MIRGFRVVASLSWLWRRIEDQKSWQGELEGLVLWPSGFHWWGSCFLHSGAGGSRMSLALLCDRVPSSCDRFWHCTRILMIWNAHQSIATMLCSLRLRTFLHMELVSCCRALTQWTESQWIRLTQLHIYTPNIFLFESKSDLTAFEVQHYLAPRFKP